ncbi:MAG: radical SAM family heme chaperone HemW [Anaerolineae bacterium]|jgi:oxygen-independent coproporphyrinogen-3 oxidase
MEAGSTGLGLYVHIPFCQAKCTYCDFNSYSGLEVLFDDYVAGLVREMELVESTQVRTAYIGGGTPTLLPLPHLTRLLGRMRDTFALNAETEISIEANPGALDSGKLGGLLKSGVNRLSLGIQSFDHEELFLLGRIHSAGEAAHALHTARQVGFDNISLDLIYGLPGQALISWQDSLKRALDLRPDHLSLYALTIEASTPLATAIAEGGLPPPDPDLAADMYEFAQEFLSAAGFVHYEISNWARTPKHVCQHNLTYWRNEAYLGVGAGAHSWQNARRWSNTAHPRDYVDQVLDGRHPLASEETISPRLEMGETMIMGLRLLDEGVHYGRFHERFGVDPRALFSDELKGLVELGLLQTDGVGVRLSSRGRLLGNQVFVRFLPD